MRETKISVRRIIFWVLTITWMVVIFSFSAKPADESTAISNAVGMKVGQVLVPGFEEWPVGEQESFAEKIDYPIRKCAHAFEYGVLAFLLVGAIVGPVKGVNKNKDSANAQGCTEKKAWISYLLAFIVAVAYAASDEIHQLFVPGRAGMVRDVLIDSGGALVGVAVFFMIVYATNGMCVKNKASF